METHLLNALSQCSLFAGMTIREIEWSLEGMGCKTVNIGRKDIYMLANFACRHVDIVVKGTLVARMVGLSGKLVEVARLGVGYVLALGFVFAQDNRMPVSVETETDVTLLRLSKTDVETPVDHDGRIRWNLIRALSDMSAFLASKMRFLSLFSVREKVVYSLLSLSRAQGSSRVTLDKSRQAIADSFGIQKFSLLRCLAELEESGAIRVDGRTITITDRGKLRL